MTTSTTTVLPRPRREGNPFRVALVISIIAAVVLTIIYFRVQKRRAALLSTQQACLDYRLSPETVVYDESAEGAAERVAKSNDYVQVQTLDPSGTPIVGRLPAPWSGMMSWARPDAPQPRDAVLFLHERTTQLGKRGLVCVQADRAGRKLRVTFVHPGTRTLDPVAITDVSVIPRPQPGLVFLSAGDDPFAAKLPPERAPNARTDLRFFAGQLDPADASHWTIPYQLDDRSGELEMWIADERVVHYLDRRFAK